MSIDHTTEELRRTSFLRLQQALARLRGKDRQTRRRNILISVALFLLFCWLIVLTRRQL
jgi:hypothetical protein